MRKVLSTLFMIAWSISAFSSSTYWIPFFSPGMLMGTTVKGVVLDQEDCFDGPYKNNTIFTIKVLDDFGQGFPDTIKVMHHFWYWVEDDPEYQQELQATGTKISYSVKEGKKYYFVISPEDNGEYTIWRYFRIKYGRTFCSEGYFTKEKEEKHKLGMSVMRFDRMYRKALKEILDFVDLGLSVKWSSANGNRIVYYAWGETEFHTSFDWSTYRLCKGSATTLTKYCTDSIYGYQGFTDGLTTLKPEDDVVHISLGDSGRMPTKAEFQELIDNCTWTWTTRDSFLGYKITSKKRGYKGRSIFLPVTGNSNSIDPPKDVIGCYWSSSLDSITPDNAWMLYFDSNSISVRNTSRSIGMFTCAVCE